MGIANSDIYKANCYELAAQGQVTAVVGGALIPSVGIARVALLRIRGVGAGISFTTDNSHYTAIPADTWYDIPLLLADTKVKIKRTGGTDVTTDWIAYGFSAA